MKRLCLSLIFYFLVFFSIALNDSISNNQPVKGIRDSLAIMQQRRTNLAIAEGTVYACSMFGFYQIKYRENLQSRLHFNDLSSDWSLGMDFSHHAIASYYICRIEYDLLRWAGVSERRATWLGGLSGFCLLTSQEILDGFAKKWGASTGDLATNALGSAVFLSQQLIWHDQRILLKWSYHPTSFPGYNPDQLGHNFVQKMIKDYNGQTFWLSANIKSFVFKNSRIPGWMNVALGISSTGITGPFADPPQYRSYPVPEFKARHTFYIAPDIDLTRIHTRSYALKWVFECIGFLKFPLPALEISSKGLKLKPLYF
jgi:hypothetical protein